MKFEHGSTPLIERDNTDPELDLKQAADRERGLLSKFSGKAGKVARALMFATTLAIGFDGAEQASALEKTSATDTEKNLYPIKEATCLTKRLANIRSNPENRISVEVADRQAQALIMKFAGQLKRHALNLTYGAPVHLDKADIRKALEEIVSALSQVADRELGDDNGDVGPEEKRKLFEKMSGKPGFDVLKHMIEQYK